MISGIVHVLKSGCRWVDAPAAYGPRETLYNRWHRRTEKGHWVRIFEALADAGGPPALGLIDSSAVSAHRSASGGKGGSCKASAGHGGPRPMSTRSRTAGAARPADAERRQHRRLHRGGGAATTPAAGSHQRGRGQSLRQERRAQSGPGPEPFRTSRRSATATAASSGARTSTGTATPSSACSDASRTSAASPRATTAEQTSSSPALHSLQQSASGYEAGA